MIICITGLAGSGKTTVANILENKLKALNYKVLHITTDSVRENLFKGEINDLSQDFSDDELKRSYNGLYFLCEEILKQNPETIIITDGTYRKTAQRLLLEVIAEKQSSKVVFIKVEVDANTAKSRLNERFKNGGLGGFVDPKDYEEPVNINLLKIKNDSNLNNLDKQIDQLINKMNLSKYYFVW